MGNDWDAARAIDRAFVRASKAHALARELAKVTHRANETLRGWGY